MASQCKQWPYASGCTCSFGVAPTEVRDTCAKNQMGRCLLLLQLCILQCEKPRQPLLLLLAADALLLPVLLLATITATLFLLLWPLLLAVTASAVAATAVAATAVATSTAARAAASETTQKNDHSCNMAQAENICQLRLRTKLQAAVYKPVRTHRYCTYQYNSIVYSPVCWRVTPVVMCSLLLWPNRALHRATAAAALVRNEKIAAALATRTAGPASTTAQLPVYRWHQQR
eukprot:2102-Heterococcus_DN1.PRE.1